ncbi:heterokaryon incompatibility protein-domain-containing protein [Leptodontidium sp. MPI-SDFR-AT-0119]|nr:heterokaryon incompatibility protein-domain-containing protein [Leptodontidium sp. MPI-SDFR-AT-0119]
MTKNDVEVDEEIEVFTARFCSESDKQGVNRETFRLVVSANPSKTGVAMGPVDAFQMEIAQKRSRRILELQECDFPIPRADEETEEVDFETEKLQKNRFSGRIVGPKVNLRLVSKWINRCGALHQKTHRNSCSDSIFPARFAKGLKALLVIDVEQMCVIDAPTPCRYVALSYCWGKAAMVKHLRENSAELRRRGGLSTLDIPVTIRDAIEVVRGVGERYLWVDALCIVQDNPVSQQAQLAQMGLVYSLAAFTIVAGSGDNANSGLPGIESWTRDITQAVIQVEDKTLLEVITGADYYKGINNSDWITRAWTMQEKLLSKKLLIFTERQVYWSCWNAVWLEEVVLEDGYSVEFQYNPLDAGPAMSGFSMLGVETGQLNPARPSTMKPVNCNDLYRDFVNAYRERRLTFQSDILNAFSGLCQALSAIGNEEYHWGLPVSRFEEALCWWVRGGGKRNNASCNPTGSTSLTVKFPSWSWTAWHGSPGYPWLSWLHQTWEEETSPGASMVFFASIVNGRMTQINHKMLESSGSPPENTLPVPDPSNCNPGHLHFQTTTATLHVRRLSLEEVALESSLQNQYSILSFEPQHYSLILDDPSHLQFDERQVMKELPEGIPEPLEGLETYNVAVLDFVVVSYLKSESVVCLVVNCEDGVAYRIGLAYFKLQRWGRVKTRQEKQVVLG